MGTLQVNTFPSIPNGSQAQHGDERIAVIGWGEENEGYTHMGVGVLRSGHLDRGEVEGELGR